jgi:hypothetical protein
MYLHTLEWRDQFLFYTAEKLCTTITGSSITQVDLMHH